MQKIAQFLKVSRAQFEADWHFSQPCPYDEIRLPRRGTSGSAGYDFYTPVDLDLAPGESVVIPTGVRARMDDGWALLIYPRSGQGWKYRLQLYNTVGVIDADYFGAENEGHIQIKLINANREGKRFACPKGTAIAQGVFTPFGVTIDDDAIAQRTGGFGSTDRR